MPSENVEILRRGYARFAAGDTVGVADLIADDAEVADVGGLGLAGTAAGTRHGPEGFLRVIEETLDAFEDYRVEPEEFIDAGDAIVVRARISGRGRASGAEMEAVVAHLWVLRDGKAVRSEVYRSVDEALEAALRQG